jgi:PadR family transcriptional regulator, regulatory protein PadR
MTVSSPVFMTGVPELLVLRLLAEREMYGYELSQAIVAITREAISVGEGALYPALHALEARGHVATRKRTVDGRLRVYYRLRPGGRRRLRELTGEWQRIAGGVAAALKGVAHA